MERHDRASDTDQQEKIELAQFSLSCPTPEPEAIASGLFAQVDDDQGVSAETVVALAREQAYDLISLQVDIIRLEICERTGQNPRTGKTPRSQAKVEANRASSGRERKETEARYAGSLSSYAFAFGEEAAVELNERIEETFRDDEPDAGNGAQQSLF